MLSAGTKNKDGYPGRMWAKWLHHPYRLGGPQRSVWAQKNRNGYLAHMWAARLHHPYRFGGFKPSAWQQKAEMATWPTCGQSGYITRVVMGVPNAQRGDNKRWRRPGPPTRDKTRRQQVLFTSMSHARSS